MKIVQIGHYLSPHFFGYQNIMTESMTPWARTWSIPPSAPSTFFCPSIEVPPTNSGWKGTAHRSQWLPLVHFQSTTTPLPCNAPAMLFRGCGGMERLVNTPKWQVSSGKLKLQDGFEDEEKVAVPTTPNIYNLQLHHSTQVQKDELTHRFGSLHHWISKKSYKNHTTIYIS